jgi:hypothetical protein
MFESLWLHAECLTVVALRSFLASLVLTQQPRARFLVEDSGAAYRSSRAADQFIIFSIVSAYVLHYAAKCIFSVRTHVEDARLRSVRRARHAMHVLATSG